jgi:hypothetical protein
MNFDKIKTAMTEEENAKQQSDLKIDLRKGKGNPVELIRQKIWFELIVTLIGAVLFLTVPYIYDIEERLASIYLIFMSITVLMLLGNLIKFSFFLKQTPTNEMSTLLGIQAFLFNIKTTLSIYKTYSVSSALLVPVPIFALILGHKNSEFYNPDLFLKYLFLDLNSSEILVMLLIYLSIALAFYFLIIMWIRYYYKKQIKELEDLLSELKD